MFIPLSDDNPLEHVIRPWVTWGLIATNVFVFVVFQSGVLVNADQAAIVGLGVIPSVFHDMKVLPEDYALVPDSVTLVSYMFLHGGWLHLIGNMLFLWVFGDNVEDAMGHVKFLAFYLLCGIAGGLTHALMMPTSDAPLIGASGAVAGLIAAYLMLHPQVRLWVLVLMRIPLRLPAVWVLGAWALFQVYHVAVSTDDGTGWWAHVGGFVAGALLVLVMRRPGVPLFDRGREPGRLTPKA
jgi:membrane associated rhomboid family serine protease